MMSTALAVIWQLPAMAPAAIAIFAIVLAAVLWLYPPQMRDLARRWQWTMPTLRIGAIAALAVSIVQPSVQRPRTAAQQGAIILMIDGSHSMSVSDRDRSPAELISLASALGALPAGTRAEASPGLRTHLESVRALLEQVEHLRGDAEYACLSGRGEPAAQARLRDAGEHLRDALKAIAPIAGRSDLARQIARLHQPLVALDESATRALHAEIEEAARLLAAEQAQQDKKLFDDNAAVRTACVRVGRLSREALVARALMRPGGALLASLPVGAPLLAFTFSGDARPLGMSPSAWHFDTSGAQSDAPGALRDVMRRLRGTAIQAVVLMSDGRPAGTSQPPNADLSALGIPVFAVAAAPLVRQRDVSIAAIDVPPTARIGETVSVRVDLRGPGAVGDLVDVQLDVGDERQINSVKIADDQTASTEFEVTLTHAGPTQLSIRAQPLAGEISDENNRATRWIKVSVDPLRVTVLAGADAGRQYTSLHEALSRAPWVALREIEEKDVDRLTAAGILSQDVIVLCDLPASALSTEQWEAMDALVRQRGGGVVLCAGAHLPGAYSDNPLTADWLPYDPADHPSWRSWPGGEPHFRLLPDRAAGMPFVSRWQQLPAISRVISIDKLRPDVTPLFVERDGGGAVITLASRGSGHVVFVGTDETWRWRGPIGAGERQSFWPELLRHVGPEPYAANEQNLWLDVSDLAPHPMQAITLRARLETSEGVPVDSPTQVVHVMAGDEEIKTATLKSLGSDGRYEGALDGLAAGEYTLRLDPPVDPSVEVPPDPVTLPLHVSQSYEAEMVDLSSDGDELRRMAESSGGRMLRLDQLASLPRLLAENRQRLTPVVEYPLWDSPWLFGFVLACLITEWALRKKQGLA